MPHLEHFAIYADDAPALKDYYVEVFGMTVAVENPGDPPGYFLADGRGMAIEIIGRPAGQSGADQRWVCHIAFWADDYEALRSRLAARGTAFEADTAVDNDALRTEFFNDPAGNRVQIVWRRKPLGG